MKRRTGIAALFLMLCLLAAVSGCGGDAREESAPPATTEAPAPQRSADSLELDGSPLGPVWLLEDSPCLALTSLTELWGLTAEEPEPGLLRLTGEGESWTLRAGSAEASAADGSGRELHGLVRKTAEGDWYLPLSALETLWGRKTVYDPDGAVLRCLRLEPGPEILLRAENGKPGSLIGGVPALSAWDLAELVSGSAEQDSADDGVPTLTLRVGERVLCFRAGSVQARLDDAPLALPAPALQEGENWDLPVGPVAEALGFAALRFPDGKRIELWPRQTGPALWLDGRGLGPTLCLDGVPCADLEALAGAVGGSLQQEGDALRLQAGEHSLVFRLGETVCSADGGELVLPVPALPVEDACCVPVLPVAEALALPPAAEGEALVFSRMEPRETQLWIDGHSTPAWGLEEGPLCVRLADIPGLTAETPEDPTETPEGPTEQPLRPGGSPGTHGGSPGGPGGESGGPGQQHLSQRLRQAPPADGGLCPGGAGRGGAGAARSGLRGGGGLVCAGLRAAAGPGPVGAGGPGLRSDLLHPGGPARQPGPGLQGPGFDVSRGQRLRLGHPGALRLPLPAGGAAPGPAGRGLYHRHLRGPGPDRGDRKAGDADLRRRL